MALPIAIVALILQMHVDTGAAPAAREARAAAPGGAPTLTPSTRIDAADTVGLERPAHILWNAGCWLLGLGLLAGRRGSPMSTALAVRPAS